MKKFFPSCFVLTELKPLQKLTFFDFELNSLHYYYFFSHYRMLLLMASFFSSSLSLFSLSFFLTPLSYVFFFIWWHSYIYIFSFHAQLRHLPFPSFSFIFLLLLFHFSFSFSFFCVNFFAFYGFYALFLMVSSAAKKEYSSLMEIKSIWCHSLFSLSFFNVKINVNFLRALWKFGVLKKMFAKNILIIFKVWIK